MFGDWLAETEGFERTLSKPFKNLRFLLAKYQSVKAFFSFYGGLTGRSSSLQIAKIRDSNGVANGVAGPDQIRRREP